MSRVRIPFPAPSRKKGTKALLAQSVERVLGKDEVSSSILEEGSSIIAEGKLERTKPHVDVGTIGHFDHQ